MVQLMPLLSRNPILSCLTGFTFPVPAYPGRPGKEAVKLVLLLFIANFQNFLIASRTHPKERQLTPVDIFRRVLDGCLSLPIFLHVTYARGSVLLWWRHGMLCASGFTDDVILALKPRQLNVAAQLMEAQPTCSLGLGYKWRVGIPVAGQWTHSRAYFSGAAVLAY